ncbi:MAG: hypothetical protein QOI36_6384 [Pseudonocardiales bacterium]|jgi:hypothetical protein|nr:hypothetical protein [Pseudonocardiales bacterium]
MPLSIVTALIRNLIMLPGAVLRRRAAKDAEVLRCGMRTLRLPKTMSMPVDRRGEGVRQVPEGL